MSKLINDGKPVQVKSDGTVWYYEDPKTLHLHVECRDAEDNYHQTINFRIPIAKLEKSIRRIKKAGA